MRRRLLVLGTVVGTISSSLCAKHQQGDLGVPVENPQREVVRAQVPLYLPTGIGPSGGRRATAPEPSARGAGGRRIPAIAYAMPEEVKKVGQGLQTFSNLLSARSRQPASATAAGAGGTNPEAPPARPPAPVFSWVAVVSNYLDSFGASLKADATAADKDLVQRTTSSFGVNTPTKPEFDSRYQGYQILLGQGHGVKTDNVENALGLRSLRVGDSNFAVHGVKPNTQMTINGAKFIGGTAPPGTSVRPVGYFVPLETKDGKTFYTGSSGNHQTTFKEGDKHYTMFFPPGTTDEQIQQAVLGAQQALQNGLNPENISDELGEKPLTTPAAALEAARALFSEAANEQSQSTSASQKNDP